VEIVVDIDRKELKGSVLITGFRGFGMVGYLVSKYLALLLNARKIGYILLERTPPMILIEEDGVGYPFDIYYSENPKAVIVVNRALPDKDLIDDYAAGLASWASRIGVRYAVLVGGLSRDYMSEGEEYGYRHVENRFYDGPSLEAPRMEQGLGVMGPLALLYVYMDYFGVPATIVLPYSTVEEADYLASATGVRIIAEKLLGVKVDVSLLENLAQKQKEALQKLLEIMVSEEKGEEEKKEGSGIYM